MRNITLSLSALAILLGATSAYAVDSSMAPDMKDSSASKSTSDTSAMKPHMMKRHMARRDEIRKNAMRDRDLDQGQNNPVTNNENYTTQGYNAPGYGNSGPGAGGYGGEGNGYAYGGFFGTPGYIASGDRPAMQNNPVTDNENYSTQGSNAPGYGNPGPGPNAGPEVGAYPAYSDRDYGYNDGYSDGRLQEGRSAFIVGGFGAPQVGDAGNGPVAQGDSNRPSLLLGPKGR